MRHPHTSLFIAHIPCSDPHFPQLEGIVIYNCVLNITRRVASDGLNITEIWYMLPDSRWSSPGFGRKTVQCLAWRRLDATTMRTYQTITTQVCPPDGMYVNSTDSNFAVATWTPYIASGAAGVGAVSSEERGGFGRGGWDEDGFQQEGFGAHF